MKRTRSMLPTLPAIRRRDARIHELGEELARSRQEVTTLRQQLEAAERSLAEATVAADDAALEAARERRLPSFGAQLAAWSRDLDRTRRRRDSSDVRVGMNRKLAMYRFAESHGVRVPSVLGLWARPEEIAWDDLPDTFVLKSDGGSSGLGVLPLARVGGRFQLAGHKASRTSRHFGNLLRARLEKGLIAPPFFAEERMVDPRSPGVLPHDLKVYSFYGEVGHILLRGLSRHGDTSTARWRFLDSAGRDLGTVKLGQDVDPTLPVPQRLPEVVEVARRLSRALPMPFSRIDLYDLPDAVWFGEVTLTPGGKQDYLPEHDRRLGKAWERAASRLAADLRGGRPHVIVAGPHEVRTPRADTVPPA